MGCISSKQGSLDISSDKPGARTGLKPLWTVLNRRDYYDRHQGRKNVGKPLTSPPPLPKAEDAKSDEEKEALHIEELDFLLTENGPAHNTERFEIMQVREVDGEKQHTHLVVRRGEAFYFLLKFDRAFNRDTDELKLIFETGENPSLSKGTSVQLTLPGDEKPKEWGSKIVYVSEKEMKIRVLTPPNLAVARWRLSVDVSTKKSNKEKTFRYTHSQNIYMLFNPWCHDDSVYLDDETCRKEYVLNDKGRIYRGTRKQISVKPWNYGQFEDFMLDCCMDLLDASELTYRLRGNPIFVSRKIAMLVNAPDDDGVVMGNWAGDYSNGTSPLTWVGSVAILQEYYKTKQPVKYGQCWVFSGVVTSVCRALGIPARSVTNYSSAHDCDGSLTIDVYWGQKGESLDDHNSDSVWNFHVWNDVWMTRPDLPSGFGGWQAIDATPQETSEGVYVTGPASLEAIKSGLVNMAYDAPFIFSEVNADKVHWKQTDDGKWSHTLQRHWVGKNISTKSPNNDDRMDITYMYKFNEGSNQERTAVWRAVKEGSQRKDIYQFKDQEVKFDLVEKENVLIGQPFNVSVNIQNKCAEERSLKITLTAVVVFYTGVPGKEIKTDTVTTKLAANAESSCELSVRPEEYLDKLVDMANIRIHCTAQVVETNEWYCECDDFRLLKPDLEIKAPSEVAVGDEFEAEISFTNPLNRSLTRCEFTLEGSGLLKPFIIKHSSVAPSSKASVSTRLKATTAGNRELVASFDSKELADVHGSATILVKSASQ